MIVQEMRRKGFEGCRLEADKGFYIEGSDFQDCRNQLTEWCNEHKEKWVYYHDCGMAPGKPIPKATHIFEVSIFDAEPAGLMLFSRLFQRGSEGKREIDAMNEKEKNELAKKHLKFFAILGGGLK